MLKEENIENRYIDNGLEKAKSITHSASLCRTISEILSICIFLGGSVVLIGWILDIPVLKNISPDFVAMKANTAICFILIGLSLWLSQTKWQGNRTVRGIARLCAFVVFLTGFLTFWEYMLGGNFGIDQLLFKEPATAILTSSPGKMAFNTSIIFAIIGIALLLLGFETVLFSYLAQLLVIPAGIITLLSFVGYLYGASPFYIGEKFSTAMAVHTCVLFIMFCIGCLFVRPEQGFMKNITSDNYGGIVLRRILPVVIVIPLVLGGLKIYGEKTGWFGNEFGVSFVATFNLVAFSLFIYMLSARLNRLDVNRRRMETALRETNAYLENLVNYANAPIIVWNPQFRITRFNHAFEFLTGRSEAEVLGQSLEILFPPALSENSMALIHKTLTGERWETVEIEIQHRDESVRTVLWNSATLFAPDGQTPIATIAQGQDITERKKVEIELKKANEELIKFNDLKDEFVSMASHELRTPLSIICGAVKLLIDEIPGKIVSGQKEMLDMAMKNLNRLARIVDSLLNISKIESGKIELCRTDVAISRLIAETVSEYGPQAENKHINLSCQLPPHSVILHADADRIKEVIVNLISNSIKFTPEGGSINVFCEDRNDEVFIFVKDTGCGVAKNDIPRMFEKFTQFDRKVGPGEKGTGLGLAICKGLINLHNGKIWAESDTGSGMKISFTIPHLSAKGVFTESVDNAVKSSLKTGGSTPKVNAVVACLSSNKT